MNTNPHARQDIRRSWEHQTVENDNYIKVVNEKPIKYLENFYGQAIRVDSGNKNRDVEDSFYPKFGKDKMNMQQLPNTTSPRLRNTPLNRMIPQDTRVSRTCQNEAIAQAGPFYLRHFPIWENAFMLPSSGDLSKDPRYGASTKKFTTSVTTRRL